MTLTIDLPEDFTAGECENCPLSYEETEYDEYGYAYYDRLCVLGKAFWECPINGTCVRVRNYEENQNT